MDRVQQPRTLVVLGLNVGMSTAAGADELVEFPASAERPHRTKAHPLHLSTSLEQKRKRAKQSKTGRAYDPSPVYPPQYPTSKPLGAQIPWDPLTLTPVATPTLLPRPVEGLRGDAQASQEAMAPPSQGQPVRDQPHQNSTLATNDSGPPRGPTVGVARAAAQAALDASSTNPPPVSSQRM